MSVTTTAQRPVPASLEQQHHPFGLPPGTVRGLLSILICAFFWIVLLLPPAHPGKVVLAHFFLLGLVLMAFASSPRQEEATPFLPWFLRLIFVGVSAAVVALAWVRDVNLLQARLTPDLEEVKMWWIPFMACMAGGFAFGLFLRFVLGKTNHVFQTLRAWFSVVGSVMLVLEIGIFLSAAGGTGAQMDFLHYWQCVVMVVVSAYFGTRA